MSKCVKVRKVVRWEISGPTAEPATGKAACIMPFLASSTDQQVGAQSLKGNECPGGVSALYSSTRTQQLASR